MESESAVQSESAVLSLLDDQICFAIYSASRALTGRYRQLLAPLDITYPQYLALLVLWQDGTLTVGQLAERLELDSGTLSPLLRRLAQAGLVDRQRSTDDERSVQISLTTRGKQMQHDARGIPDSICSATGLDLEELVALQKQLVAVAGNVRAAQSTTLLPRLRTSRRTQHTEGK